jgi:hypothetical protein
MTRKEAERLARQADVLRSLGFTSDEAESLRRISMTLQRWHELECGDGNGHIERDEKTGKPRYFNSRARYVDPHDPRAWSVIADRETGAKKRLAAIMAQHNGKHCPKCEPSALQPCGQECRHVVGKLTAYIQTDPRGAALYIIRPGDVPAGADVDAYYSRGICVY